MSAFESRTIDLQGLLDQKQPDSRPSTRPTTTTFRTISRQTKANWSNRFRRDVNDLEYDVKYNLIKGKSDLNQQSKYHKNLKSKFRPSQTKRSQSRESGITLEKYKKGMDMMKISQTNPERFDLIEQKKYSTVDTQGLCKHEFQKTIGGKLIHKSNHHMGFQYQTERSVNLNPVWYESSKEIDLIKIMKKNKMNKSHGFSSYTQRKVFQPREQLDKFYDTAHSFRIASAKTVKQTYKIDGMTGRKDPKPPLGTKLVYNEHKSKQKILTRTIALPLSSLKRELHFSRQVISPERGCYR